MSKVLRKVVAASSQSCAGAEADTKTVLRNKTLAKKEESNEA
jgi:hypothetical protein